MATTSRALEITVISGEDLRLDSRRPVKKNAFVVILTNSWNDRTTTKVDLNGGAHPMWNEKLAVELPSNARFLTVELQCRTYSGDKVVGAARVPVTDFAGGFFPDNYLHFLSYRLRDGRGERNGIINLSVRVKGTVNNAVKAAACGGAASCSQPWMGGPVTGEVCNGVVTGVPVWHSY